MGQSLQVLIRQSRRAEASPPAARCGSWFETGCKVAALPLCMGSPDTKPGPSNLLILRPLKNALKKCLSPGRNVQAAAVTGGGD